jgi:hypothetical protein
MLALSLLSRRIDSRPVRKDSLDYARNSFSLHAPLQREQERSSFQVTSLARFLAVLVDASVVGWGQVVKRNKLTPPFLKESACTTSALTLWNIALSDVPLSLGRSVKDCVESFNALRHFFQIRSRFSQTSLAFFLYSTLSSRMAVSLACWASCSLR